MKRRDFVQTLGAAAAGASLKLPTALLPKKLDRIGLELFAVRNAMQENPERTLAEIRAIGYTDVELLWSFGNFGRTPEQVSATLKNEGLRAPSCHMSAETIFVGWEKSLEIAKMLGQEYCFVPDFDGWTKTSLDHWRQWADRFNAAGAVARRYGVWLGFHNEPYHQRPVEGQVPLDVFIGGGDPFQYMQKYPNRFWSFHVKDAKADRSGDTALGTGVFDFKKFFASVPQLDQKPAHVEEEGARDAAGQMAAARANFQYLKNLEF
jgi:sugar phosphate isomerase/epimerase